MFDSKADEIEHYIIKIEEKLRTLSEIADRLRNLEDEIECITDEIKSEEI